jgi:hypothetical protein
VMYSLQDFFQVTKVNKEISLSSDLERYLIPEEKIEWKSHKDRPPQSIYFISDGMFIISRK